MTPCFNAERFFQTSIGWYVSMRSGDQHQPCYCGLRLVEYSIVDGTPIAGPFNTKLLLLKWLDGFISFHAKSRNTCDSYISDDIILPDRS